MKFININSDSRSNNFKLIRFIAALAVLISHSFIVVLGYPEADPLYEIINKTIGGIAVDIFFVISGFLVTKSLISRKSIRKYLWARFLRIYPALIVAVLIIVFGIGLIFTNLSPSEYLTDSSTYHYLIKNILTLAEPTDTLPGVFINNAFPEYISGQLWTLSYEVTMYLILALIGFFSWIFFKNIKFNIIKNLIILIFIGTFAINVYYHLNNFIPNTLNIDLFNNNYHFYVMFFINFCSLFCFGALLYFFRDKIKIPKYLILVFIPLIILSALNINIFSVLYLILMPLFIIGLSYLPCKPLNQFNRFGDYSYGIYIYAFPIQQLIVAIFPQISILGTILSSFVITYIFAFASWHLLEKRMLKLKNSIN